MNGHYFDDEEVSVKDRAQDHETNRRVDDILGGPTSLVPQRPPSSSGLIAQLAEVIPMVAGRTRDRDALRKIAARIGEDMADEAYYSFPAGKSRIEGPTVWLMEALRNEYGFLMAAVDVDRVIPTSSGDEVHVTATVVDLLNVNFTRRPNVFTCASPPAKFADNAEQSARWRAMQFGSGYSKAVRTALEHALPRWYWEPALDAARGSRRKRALTYRDAAGKTQTYASIVEAINACLTWFSSVSVSVSQLEEYLGSGRETWTYDDLFELRSLAQRAKRGEVDLAALLGSGPSAPTKPGGRGLSDIVEEVAAARSEAPPAGPAPTASRADTDRPPPQAEPDEVEAVDEKAADKARRRLLVGRIDRAREALSVEGWHSALKACEQPINVSWKRLGLLNLEALANAAEEYAR